MRSPFHLWVNTQPGGRSGKISLLTSDIIRTGVLSLWRQKLRTTLTLIGVAIGCGTLVVSLACGIGVKEAVDAQFRKEDRLRQITVFPAGDRVDETLAGVPEEILKVPGEMSDAKRERIRKQEVQSLEARQYPRVFRSR